MKFIVFVSGIFFAVFGFYYGVMTTVDCGEGTLGREVQLRVRCNETCDWAGHQDGGCQSSECDELRRQYTPAEGAQIRQCRASSFEAIEDRKFWGNVLQVMGTSMVFLSLLIMALTTESDSVEEKKRRHHERVDRAWDTPSK